MQVFSLTFLCHSCFSLTLLCNFFRSCCAIFSAYPAVPLSCFSLRIHCCAIFSLPVVRFFSLTLLCNIFRLPCCTIILLFAYIVAQLFPLTLCEFFRSLLCNFFRLPCCAIFFAYSAVPLSWLSFPLLCKKFFFRYKLLQSDRTFIPTLFIDTTKLIQQK